MLIQWTEEYSHVSSRSANEFAWCFHCVVQQQQTETDGACPGSPEWVTNAWPSMWGTHEGKGSSLARNDAVIGISTNNTRIHHSHGNITQSYTVHVLCASNRGKKLHLEHILLLFLQILYDSCITFHGPSGLNSMLTTTLALLQYFCPDVSTQGCISDFVAPANVSKLACVSV